MDFRKRVRSISELFVQQFGYEIDENTLLICDNASYKIRSFIGRTKKGIFELRFYIDKGVLVPLGDEDGEIQDYKLIRKGLETYDRY